MAQFSCRWRSVFICMCAPCILLVLIFLYVILVITITMSGVSHSHVGHANTLQAAHFIAAGGYKNKTFALTPKTFWRLREKAFWNRAQNKMDRFFNPLLRPRITGRRLQNDKVLDSLQRWSVASGVKVLKKRNKTLTEHMQTFVANMDRRDYPIIIEPEACGAGSEVEREPPLILLAIKSTELNFANRQAIRHTWGKVGWVGRQRRNRRRGEVDGGYIRRVFLLGIENPQEQSGRKTSTMLKMESDSYKDILQWDFKDTFFNLTLKDVLFWRWFSKRCGTTLFILKGDDDVVVNTPNMVAFLRDTLRNPLQRKNLDSFMVGEVIDDAEPNRLNQSKYYVPKTFYMGLYPLYAGGGGVVYSGALAQRLFNISKTLHLFPIDDVFVGMCMQRLNIRPIHHDAFLTFDFPKKELKQACHYHTILLVHKRTPRELYKIWTEIQTQPQCWDVPLRAVEKKKKPVTTAIPD
ncbi:N-acetyllactosaminide beta-1,3-N-acetylglucosaminyltransferase 2-like [Neosynchiropus ocellatus]